MSDHSFSRIVEVDCSGLGLAGHSFILLKLHSGSIRVSNHLLTTNDRFKFGQVSSCYILSVVLEPEILGILGSFAPEAAPEPGAGNAATAW